MITFTQLCGEELILLLFGNKYFESVEVFKILSLGVCGSFLLRQPFGILINVSGRPSFNLINGILVLISTVLLLYFLVPKYGVVGAAYSSAIMLWGSGLLSLLTYYLFVFKRLDP
ncbi:hypothetical protein BZG09_16900 [Salinivibrio kushneri]|uniref:Polysaccharide biosynthesis protein C-terminal domain-containing protein n=1 Tax=Salinivibrio kushneri TaxID=1908198 RepID=A0AB36JWT1_9GAMM|nr:hypothetical protein BZG09_16900 [Salinivibrio kushneri]